MARPAARPAPSQAARNAALDARLKHMFQAIAGEPSPSRLLQHVEALEQGGRPVNGKAPGKRRP